MKRLGYFVVFLFFSFIQSHSAQESKKKKPLHRVWVTMLTGETYKGFIKSPIDTLILITENPYDEAAIKFVRGIKPSAIKVIKTRKKGAFWNGFVTGTALGFITGYIVGRSDGNIYFSSGSSGLAMGVVGTAPGSLLGGLIGSVKLRIPIGGSPLKYKKEFKKILERSY